jgi:hypothetical protein
MSVFVKTCTGFVLHSFRLLRVAAMLSSTSLFHRLGIFEKPRNCHCEESGRERVGRGNDDEAICALASGERKARLLRRAPHPASPLRTPRNDKVWAFSTAPYLRVIVALPLIITLLITGCGESSKKVLLQMKFQPDRELVYEQTNEQKISMGDSGEVSSLSRSKGEMIQKVVEILSDGGAKINEASTWSWSEKDTNNTIKVVSRTENLVYQMAANGKISALELPSDDKESQWKEYAQSNLEQSQPTFPDEPVGKGYIWMQTVKVFMPSGEKLDASTTYKVTDFVDVDGHKCVVIDYKGNLILPFDVIESDTLTRKGVDRVDVTGQIWFDYEHGYVFSQQEKDRIAAERSKVLTNQATRYTAYIENEIYFHLKSAK